MVEKITALYARFSRDDGQVTESASITHQRQLLQEYADHNGYTNCRFYADDGFTGTNFDRPDFNRMIEDVKNGLISTIIVKDMSRFGRNYILVGQYVELILPMYDVKVIGVNDNYDSSENDNDLFAFENILNEMYTADISRKVKMVKQNKGNNGGRLITRPIYGYRKVEGTVDDWEIDEEAVITVRLIFDLYVNKGLGVYAIASQLRKSLTITPNVYFNHVNCNRDNPYNWRPNTVEKLLKHQEYCGDTVNFKSRTINHKAKIKISVPKDERKIFKDTHPAIISREIFEKAQKRLNGKRKPFPKAKSEYNAFFRGKCLCSECLKVMNVYISGKNQEKIYQCKDNMLHRSCVSHLVRESAIRRTVQLQLTQLHNAIVANENEVYAKLGISELSDIKSQLETDSRRISELDSLIKSLFESRFSDELSDEDFMSISQRYSDERSRLQESVNKLSRELNSKSSKLELIMSRIEYIRDLPVDMLNEPTIDLCEQLIDKIVVGRFAGFGEVHFGKQVIEIYLKDIGKLGDIIDVSYKTYEERVLSVLPALAESEKYPIKRLCELLGIEQSILRDGLKKEGLKFSDFKDRFPKKNLC